MKNPFLSLSFPSYTKYTLLPLFSSQPQEATPHPATYQLLPHFQRISRSFSLFLPSCFLFLSILSSLSLCLPLCPISLFPLFFALHYFLPVCLMLSLSFLLLSLTSYAPERERERKKPPSSVPPLSLASSQRERGDHFLPLTFTENP